MGGFGGSIIKKMSKEGVYAYFSSWKVSFFLALTGHLFSHLSDRCGRHWKDWEYFHSSVIKKTPSSTFLPLPFSSHPSSAVLQKPPHRFVPPPHSIAAVLCFAFPGSAFLCTAYQPARRTAGRIAGLWLSTQVSCRQRALENTEEKETINSQTGVFFTFMRSSLLFFIEWSSDDLLTQSKTIPLIFFRGINLIRFMF